MNIDWSKAPEGATHYAPAGKGLNERWFDMTTGELGSVWYEDQWHVINFSASRKDLIARPCAEWNGEGLPPVGTVCEWKEKTGFSWVKATVLFISESSVVMQREDGFEWQMLTKRTVFRPIRTPEKIAAEEREKFISEICGLLGWDASLEHSRRDAIKLFGAGYRKFEIVEGE